MKEQCTIQLSHKTQTQIELIARLLAQLAQSGDIIFLKGDLGVGKTVFARAFIQELTSPLITVPSPTFTILQTYETIKGPLWHLDLYRISNPDEVEELGFPPHESVISLVEWPAHLPRHLLLHPLIVEINIATDNTRDILLSLPQARTAQMQSQLKENNLYE